MSFFELPLSFLWSKVHSRRINCFCIVGCIDGFGLGTMSEMGSAHVFLRWPAFSLREEFFSFQ